MLFTTSGGTGETARNSCCDVKRAVGRVNNKINIYLHFCVFEPVCHKNNIVFHAVRLQCWSKHWKSLFRASWLVDLWAWRFFFSSPSITSLCIMSICECTCFLAIKRKKENRRMADIIMKICEEVNGEKKRIIEKNRTENWWEKKQIEEERRLKGKER